MGDLREDFLPGIQRKNEEAKQEEAKRLRVLHQQKIAEQKKQAKKAKIRRNIVIAAASYLVLVNLLGAVHAYDELAIERGAEKYSHRTAGTNYVFEEGERKPTVGDVFERMGETPENMFFPTWIFDEDEMRRD